MINFQLQNQQCIDHNYQGICLTNFLVITTEDVSEEQLLEQFIHSTTFSYYSLREVIKQNPEQPYLRQAFDPSLLSIHDFTRGSKAQVVKFLLDFENEKWGDDDKDDFIFIKNLFLIILDSVTADCFFIINKDWFAKGDAKVLEPYDWVYVYYFLIIWIEKGNRFLTISEWTYD